MKKKKIIIAGGLKTSYDVLMKFYEKYAEEKYDIYVFWYGEKWKDYAGYYPCNDVIDEIKHEKKVLYGLRNPRHKRHNVYPINDINSEESISCLKKINADCLIVLSWSQVFSKEVLDVVDCYNFETFTLGELVKTNQFIKDKLKYINPKLILTSWNNLLIKLNKTHKLEINELGF